MSTERASWRPTRTPQQASQAEHGDGGAGTNADAESPTKKQKRDSGKGKSRGSRQHKGGANKNWTSKDTNVAAIMNTMARLALQTAARNRLALGAVVDVALVLNEAPLAVEMQAEFQAHRSKAAAMRTALAENPQAAAMSTLGAPTATLAMTLLETLIQMDVGTVPRRGLEEILAAKPSKETLEEWFAFIKVERCADKTRTKLTLAMVACPHRSGILNALRIAGVDIRSGPAPPGWLEDELAAWLPVLESAMDNK